MPLSWNEIRDRALTFSREWADESSEDAEAKCFWDSFFCYRSHSLALECCGAAPAPRQTGVGMNVNGQ